MAQDDLLITPKRLIFDRGASVERINLLLILNTATYNISFMQFKMDDNGNFIVINEVALTKFAHKKFYDSFHIGNAHAPNEAQSVRF
jgi:hypothetical protein